MGGEVVDAETALAMGLVNRLHEPEALLDAVLASAAKLASKGPRAVALAKRVLLEGADADARAASALEQAAFGTVFGTEESSEGMDAFLAKRPPKF
jgi:enoyl-CoA hydratase